MRVLILFLLLFTFSVGVAQSSDGSDLSQEYPVHKEQRPFGGSSQLSTLETLYYNAKEARVDVTVCLDETTGERTVKQVPRTHDEVIALLEQRIRSYQSLIRELKQGPE
jgi:hypothetical protein